MTPEMRALIEVLRDRGKVPDMKLRAFAEIMEDKIADIQSIPPTVGPVSVDTSSIAQVLADLALHLKARDELVQAQLKELMLAVKELVKHQAIPKKPRKIKVAHLGNETIISEAT